MMSAIKKLFSDPYRHRRALETALEHDGIAADMTARNLGYLSLEDLQEKANAEECDQLLAEGKRANEKLADAARLMAEAESAAAKSRELEAVRRDLYAQRNQIEVRLKELQAFDYAVEEKGVLSELTALAAKTYGDSGPDQQDVYTRNALVGQLSVIRANRDIYPSAIARLKERLNACSEAIARIEAA